MSRSDSCGSVHSWSALSYTTSTLCIVLILFTIPLNTAVIVAIFKSKNHSSCFYMIMLNIAMSDLLVGAIVDPLGAVLIIKEGLQVKLTGLQIQAFVSILFILGTSSVLSMALLNIDRFVSIQWPQLYSSIKKLHLVVVFIALWAISIVCGYLSIVVGFALFLLIFSIATVFVTMTIMCVTMRTFWKKLVTVTNVEDANLSIDPNQQHSTFATTKVFSIGRFRASANERRIIRTLFFMLIIFISCYFPVFLACIYLNICKNCDCLIVHILRDVTILAILVSSVARPINFLRRLSNLREELHCSS